MRCNGKFFSRHFYNEIFFVKSLLKNELLEEKSFETHDLFFVDFLGDDPNMIKPFVHKKLYKEKS